MLQISVGGLTFLAQPNVMPAAEEIHLVPFTFAVAHKHHTVLGHFEVLQRLQLLLHKRLQVYLVLVAGLRYHTDCFTVSRTSTTSHSSWNLQRIDSNGILLQVDHIVKLVGYIHQWLHKSCLQMKHFCWQCGFKTSNADRTNRTQHTAR